MSFDKEIERMQRWAGTHISLANARELLNLMPQGNDTLRDTLFADDGLIDE